MVYLNQDTVLGYKEEGAVNETPTAELQTNYIGHLYTAPALPDPKRTIEAKHLIGAGSRKPDHYTMSEYKYEGSCEYEVINPSVLEYGLGADSGSLITISDLKTRCIEAKMISGGSTFLRYFTGVYVDSLRLKGEEKGTLVAEENWIAMDAIKSANAVSAVTVATDDPWRFCNADLTIFGSSFARLLAFDIEIKNNLTPHHYYNSTAACKPYEIVQGGVDISAKLTVVPTDTTVWDEIGSDTGFDFNIAFTRMAADTLTLRNPTATECLIPDADHSPDIEDAMQVEVNMLMTDFEIAYSCP